MKKHFKRFLSIVKLSLLVAFYHTLIDLLILITNGFLFKNIGPINNSIVAFVFVGLIVGIVIELSFLLPAALIYRFLDYPYRARIFIATILFASLKLIYLYYNDGDAPLLTQNLFLFTSYTLTSLYFFYLLFKNLSDALLTGEKSLAARFQYWWSEKFLGND
ncbi:MAG: hypothetical protein AAGD28_22140 [Bacteroidota bacterium]